MDYLGNAQDSLNVLYAQVQGGATLSDEEVRTLDDMISMLGTMRKQLIVSAIEQGVERAVIAQTFSISMPRISQIKKELSL